MKTPINIIGSCIAMPIIQNIPDFRQKYTVLKNGTYDHRYRDKLSTSNIPPGKIAIKLYNQMYDKIFVNNDWIPENKLQDVQSQFDQIVKKQTVASTINYAAKNDGPIYVDLMYEFLPSVITDTEEFMLRNNYWDTIYQFFPDWLNDIIKRNIFQFDMFDRTMVLDRHHRLRSAVSTINSINRPVIALGNVFTNKLYMTANNCIVQNFNFFNSNVPFINVRPNGSIDPYGNYEYAKDQINNFFRVCQQPKMSPGWQWLDVESDAYADDKHMWGSHPLHLHDTANKIIGQKLGYMITKMKTS